MLLLRLMATLVDVTFICAGQKGGWPLRRDMAVGPGFPMPHPWSYNRRSCLSVLPPRSQFSGFQDSDDAAPLGTRVLLQTDDENISTAPAKAEPRRGSARSRAVLPEKTELGASGEAWYQEPGLQPPSVLHRGALPQPSDLLERSPQILEHREQQLLTDLPGS